jgi:hypothetical protein
MADEIAKAAWVPTEYEAQYGDHIPQGIESARRMVSSRGRFVLFVDVLGFADLVEEDEELHIQWAATLSYMRASMRSRAGTALQKLFDSFHRAIRDTLAEQQVPPPAIVFSDSAFISESTLMRTLEIARALMRRLVEGEVPARMGLGYGGFTAARFSTETEGMRTNHISEFYGTAVVRAHRAESCGVIGMRILIHPSVIVRIEESRKPAMPVSHKPVPLPWTVSLPTAAPKYGVTHELNYLAEASHKSLDKKVLAMSVRAPVKVYSYYDETLIALQRMRESYLR